MTELMALSIGYVLFVALIGLEFAWSRWKADGGYRMSQVIVNIGHGVLFQVFDGFTKTLVAAPFLYIAAQWSPWQLPADAVWGWIVGLLVFDFAGYWRHRHHHEIGALWAIHGVHHAASDYNFAAALRQATFKNLLSWIWFAPLALVMPAKMFVGLIVFDYLYQFLQHTRYVPKLGPFEWVFNTPSHHRVHHGTEPEYLDKNYGGILIIWDRLFGTFAEERQEPTYGLTKPLGALDPVWGNLALWADLHRAAKATPRWADKARIWLGPPDTVDRLAPGVVVRNDTPLEDADVPQSLLHYVAISFSGVPLLLGTLAWMPADDLQLRGAVAAAVVASIVAPAGLLERRGWAVPLEALRLAGLAALTLAGTWTALGALLLAVAAAAAAGAQVFTSWRAELGERGVHTSRPQPSVPTT